MFVLIAAMLANGAIALVLYWLLGAVRVSSVARGEVHLADVALSKAPWPEQGQKINNALENQFELPILFYVACGISIWLGPIWVEMGLAWLFVVARVGHAIVYTTHNQVRRRFEIFAVGYALVVLLWADLSVRVALFALGLA